MNDPHLSLTPMPEPATADHRRLLRASTVLSACALVGAAIVACGGGGGSSGVASPAVGPSTAGVLCDYSSSVFNSSPSVTDRRNGARDVRRNGASFWLLNRAPEGLRDGVILPLLRGWI